MKFKILNAAARMIWPAATPVASLGAQFSLCARFYSVSQKWPFPSRVSASAPAPQPCPSPGLRLNSPFTPGSAEGPPLPAPSRPAPLPVPAHPTSVTGETHLRGHRPSRALPPGVCVPGSPGPITIGVPSWEGELMMRGPPGA